MNNNTVYHLQPTTLQPTQRKIYPVIGNTCSNPYGVEDEVIDLMKQKPIGIRPVSCFVRTPVDGADYNGDYLPLGALLNADSPQVEALRIEPNYMKKKQMDDELPIFTPCCVLRYDFGNQTYYPINYTCLLDFEILQDDNPTVDLPGLKQDLAGLPQIYYCGLATNGIDLFCIVPILAPQRYTSHANALRELFSKQGIIIRTYYQIAHTRTLSSDPSGYFNDRAIEFTKIF